MSSAALGGKELLAGDCSRGRQESPDSAHAGGPRNRSSAVVASVDRAAAIGNSCQGNVSFAERRREIDAGSGHEEAVKLCARVSVLDSAFVFRPWRAEC